MMNPKAHAQSLQYHFTGRRHAALVYLAFARQSPDGYSTLTTDLHTDHQQHPISSSNHFLTMASTPDLDTKEADEQPKQHKDLLATAKRLRGRLPSKRPTREQIEMIFLQMGVCI